MLSQKIKSLDQLEKIANQLKKQGKKIVTTNGVFDILHLGHVRYLQEAKKLGDILIVAINADQSVRQIKGTKRPLNKEKERAEILTALECVDYVTIFKEKTPKKVLARLKPDVHTKGGVCTLKEIAQETAPVIKNRGKVFILSKTKGYSTSQLIRKIMAVYRKN